MTPAAAVLVPRVEPSIAALTAGATARRQVYPADARSGSRFERVVLDGEPHFLKVLSYRTDWIMRVIGDRDLRTFRIWRAGLMHRFPAEIDHTVVAMARDGEGLDAELGILMRDVGDRLIPPGDEPISTETHARFLDHLAAMCVAFRGWRDDHGLTTMTHRLGFVAPDTIAGELAGPAPDLVVQLADQGWARLREVAPELAALVTAVQQRPDPLVTALAQTPVTFLHGDWKMGNLGGHPDGRTILVDCAYPGSGPPCWDLMWYLALNRARLPVGKAEVIVQFRTALARRGWETGGWFDRQLALCQLGMITTFGWEKALGAGGAAGDAELDWWQQRALAAARELDAAAPGWR
jgi:Phosphotransferase enzyme family